MRKSLKDFFEGVTIKNTLFTIIWTAGVIGWMYFYQEFKIIRCEASATWTHVQSIQEQRKENKNEDDAPAVESKDEAAREVSLEGEADNKPSVSPPSIEELIKKYFKDDYKTARAVAFAESRLNPNALGKNTNGTTDCGVFQINSIHGLKDCQDPVKNIEYAKQLFDRSGWYPWVAWKTGKYLAYL